MLVDAEQLFRDNRALTRRLKEAKLRFRHACLEDLDYAPRRGLDRAVIRQLATWPLDRRASQHPDYRRHRRRQDVSGLRLRAAGLSPGPSRDLSPPAAPLCGAHARARGRLLHRRCWRGSPASMSSCSTTGASARSPTRHRHDLLEILDDRDGTRSTVITSQLPRDRWHEYLGDPTVADAILDRLVHRAHRLTLGGPSRRKPNGNGHQPRRATHEHPDTISGGYHGSARAIVATGHPERSAIESRRPVDRARAVENAQNAFPQALGRRTERAAHNGPQGILLLI